MKPSLFCVHILTPPSDTLYVMTSFLGNSSTCKPHNIDHTPTTPDPFPFSGPQLIRPTSMTLFWDPFGMSHKLVWRYYALLNLFVTYSKLNIISAFDGNLLRIPSLFLTRAT